MKLFTKKWIFSFLASFFITFVAGFFIWSAFVDFPGNIIKQVLSQSTAALSAPINELAPAEDEPVPDFIAPEALSFQDQLDDIQEKLDIIKQKVDELIAEKNHAVIQSDAPSDDRANLDDQNDNKGDDLEDLKEYGEVEEATSCVGKININTASAENLDEITQVGPATAQKIMEARPFYSIDDLLKVSGIGETTLQKIKDQGCAYVESGLVPPASFGGGSGGDGGDTPTYPKILISEVQISPIGERFIELYNPIDQEVSLVDWYIQRKDGNDASWGSLISHTKFDGKTISAKGYFLISREIADSDILYDFTLSNDNSLALKNPNGDISDKLGFGNALDPESSPAQSFDSSKSIGRKFVDGAEQDTDNNSADFEINIPTPKGQNITYIEPSVPTLVSIAITTPADKLDYNVGDELDITGLVVTGTYSDDSMQVETITLENITGFDSSVPVIGQILTITLSSQATTYAIDINEATSAPNIVSYTLQVSGQDPVQDNNVFINSTNGVKIEITADKPCKFEIWINEKKYWYTTTFVTSVSRPSSGCSYWTGTQNSCSGDVLPDGVYLIKIVITDSDGNSITDVNKTITIDNSLPAS